MSLNKATQTYVCLSKVRYTDWDKVKETVAFLRVKWDCPTLSGYRCTICGGFHITSKKTNYDPGKEKLVSSNNRYAPAVRNKEEADHWIEKKGWNKPPKRAQEHLKAVKRKIKASKRFK